MSTRFVPRGSPPQGRASARDRRGAEATTQDPPRHIQLLAEQGVERYALPGMSPATPDGVSASDASSPNASTAGAPGDPLVPLLPVEAGAPDPVALSMWHLALGSAIGVEVPHDLFALWLFPVSGGVVLIGPDALALDRVDVPPPAPRLRQCQLYQLEEVLRHAKYASAIALPVQDGERDLGVMLLGSFDTAAFGPAEALALHRLAGRLVPALTRLAEGMQSATPHAALEPAMSPEALPDHIARAASEAAGGPGPRPPRLGERLRPAPPHAALDPAMSGEALPDHIARAGTEARSGPALVRRASGI